jgi:aryl-alcohol dehydrogenase-like predicted oxidoreductase
MDTVFMGRSGLRVSRLVMGTMTFGDGCDESLSHALFERARSAGINFFDCADVYARGQSEEILGRLIRACREEVLISTKAYFPTSGHANARGASRRHLKLAVEASLRRLQTDFIDVFFLHRFDDVTDIEDSLGALSELVAAGKIHSLGLSNASAWQTMKMLALCERRGWPKISVIQPMYNLAKRQAEVEILPMARSEGLGVIPYSPLGGGLLSGKYSDPEAQGRIRSNAMYRVRYGDPKNFEIAEGLSKIAKERGLSPASLAIAWVMNQPGVTAPIIGAHRLEHLEAALAASEITMDEDLRAAIAAISLAPSPATDRNEETSAHNYGAR